MTAVPRLTESEHRVLCGMALGQTNREIGRQLHLSEHTVKTHARRMFLRLGARDRAHAVHIAHQKGLLT